MRKIGSKIVEDSDHHLDFGCGAVPGNPFRANRLTSVDVNPDSNNIEMVVITPGSSLPFPNETFTSVSAYDVLEDLPRVSDTGNLYIYYMNELCRVLKPGVIAIFIFPSFPHRDAFYDPSHVNYITRDTVDFFLATPGGPFYENIETTYEIIRNKKLRVFGHWVYDAEMLPSERKSLSPRRRLSLGKRTVLRFLFPGHRIWILQKRTTI